MNSQLDKLIQQVMCDPADDGAVGQLSAHLEAHPQDRRDYLDYCRVHGDLAYVASAEGAEQQALDALAAQMLRPAADGTSPPGGPHPRRGAKRTPWFFLALAASIVLLFVISDRPPQGSGDGDLAAGDGHREPTIVATVASVENASWVGRRYDAGAALRLNQQIKLAGGLVKLKTPSGAELLLEGPCDIEFDSAASATLRRGKLTARLADWATGYAVTTESLRVVDLGSMFAVLVDGAGTVEAHALEGDLRVQSLKSADRSRTSIVVAQGQAVRVNLASRKTERVPAEQEQFVLSHGEFRPFRPLELHNTGRGLEVGDEDPHWRIVEGAIGAGFHGPQYAVVCEPDERYLPNHKLASQWMSVARDLRPGCLPNSVYTFRTEFDLTGYDLETVTILADMMADNGVAEVRINGRPATLNPWRDNEYLQEFRQFRRAEIVDGFVPGVNTIEIDVLNGIYVFDPEEGDAKPTPNPMALRVEWQAFGSPLTSDPGGDHAI